MCEVGVDFPHNIKNFKKTYIRKRNMENWMEMTLLWSFYLEIVEGNIALLLFCPFFTYLNMQF